MIIRFTSYLSIGTILIGLVIIIYHAYWLSIGLQTVPEQKLNAPTVSSINAEVIPGEGQEIGVLTIPKLDRSLHIYQGIREETLKKGIGHIPYTPLPGEKSNSILAGHRDTFFRNLDQLKIGDVLIIRRSNQSYIYKVKKIRIVDKDDKTVIIPKPRSTLTLITCFPFTFIGSAPERYIIESELISKPKIEIRKKALK